MLATIISDADYQTETFTQLHRLVQAQLKEKGFEIRQKSIGRDDLAFCMGCFGCWVKTPGECVIKDAMAELNNTSMNSDVVVYLSPVIFGQFSANIKNAIDRWLPNMLPLFVRRPDGSTIHPPRYRTYPRQFIIGYGDSVSGEEASLFVDITEKHRRNVTALVFQGNARQIADVFAERKLIRVGGGL